eukprot:5631642-Amphidinium_carterae.1
MESLASLKDGMGWAKLSDEQCLRPYLGFEVQARPRFSACSWIGQSGQDGTCLEERGSRRRPC